MYAAYFGLKQEPFSIAPDPRLLFMSERHREALAHLLYGVQGGGGFVLLTGEIGTGKTTVCRSFLEQVPQHCNLAYIFNPKLTVRELLETVCHEFGIEVPQSAAVPPTVKDYLDPLNAFLLQAHAAGRNNVLVIDEAQNLSADVLEQLRLLTNLETSERKLLQIILIGQPELRAMLAQSELEQLAQRVIARYHLQALSEAETAHYIRHRLEVCGLQRPLPFDRAALKRIHSLTGGVPRRINLLCDRALLGAFASGQATVTRRIAERAAAEVFDNPSAVPRRWRQPAFALGLGLAAGAGLLAAANRFAVTPEPAAKPVAEAAKPPGPMLTASPTASQTMAATATATATASVAALPAHSAQAPSFVPTESPAAKPTLLENPQQAWRELARAWGLALAETGDPCRGFQRQQIHCFSRRLSLPLIRQLGRPGIVTLDAASGRPLYAVLSGLTDQTATLQAGGTEQTVTLVALAQRWQGDFATLWREPPGYSGSFGEGQGGPLVEWVAQSLVSIQASQPRKGPVMFDELLKAQVRSFQLAQGLPVDGKLGPLTLMQLNRAAGVDEPRLRTQP